MHQLDMFAPAPVADPPTLHELKRAGLSFIVKTWRGYSVYLPFNLGASTGMYFTAKNDEQALKFRDDFNHGVDVWEWLWADETETAEQQKGSGT